MRMSTRETYLRILTGFLLVAGVFAYGVMGRAPVVIAGLALVFTVLYIHSKWHLWKPLTVAPYGVKLLKLLGGTFVSQLVVCGVIYLCGRGVGNLLEIGTADQLSVVDVIGLGALLATGLALGHACNVVARQKVVAEHSISVSAPEPDSPYRMIFDPEPLTLDNFYTGLWKRLVEVNPASSELIAQTEERLGITLPPLLRRLYEKQNGGMCDNLWVPAVPNPSDNFKDWRGVFAHDYCYLLPLEKLDRLYASYRDFLSEEEIEERDDIPTHAKKMIVLAQRYMDTTYLDYSEPGAPRVGIVDFDGINKCDVRFNDFDTFFAALKRGEIE
jgi:SMI1 / KNR4 family (SUKH-1)